MFATDAATASGSGIWRLTNSPYYVQSNLIVTNLTIEPGVVVLVAGNCELRVTDWLQATGASNNLITFKRANPSVRWSGIVFANASSNCVFDYCWVEGANSSGVRITNTRLVFRSTVIVDNLGPFGGGIKTDSDLTLQNCTVSRNSIDATAGYGGGIFSSANWLRVAGGNISGNTDAVAGGQWLQRPRRRSLLFGQRGNHGRMSVDG